MGFLTFLKKSKAASTSSPDDAGLSIPPPPPFPKTADPQRDLPPFTSNLPDFKPFNQKIDSPPLELPEMEEPAPMEAPFYERMQAPEPEPVFQQEESEPEEEPEEHELPTELPPLDQPVEQPKPETPIHHINGAIFMKASRVSQIGSDLNSASDRLKRMGIKIKHLEEQEKAVDKWKEDLESLYRKLAATEKSIFV